MLLKNMVEENNGCVQVYNTSSRGSVAAFRLLVFCLPSRPVETRRSGAEGDLTKVHNARLAIRALYNRKPK